MSSHLLSANVDIVRLKLRIRVIGIASETTDHYIAIKIAENRHNTTERELNCNGKTYL